MLARDTAAAHDWYERAAASGNQKAALRLKDLQAQAAAALAPDPAALRRAAQRGDTATLRALLASGTDVNAADPHGRTALIEAVAGQHVDAVQLLLSAGATPDTTDDTGSGALHMAAQAGNTDDPAAS